METSRWIRPEIAKRWIALDGTGEPHGRFHSTSAMSETVVIGLMRSLLPEVADLQLVSWNRATTSQRQYAAGFKPFTPLVCVKLGIQPKPEPPPPTPAPPPAPSPLKPAGPKVEGLPPVHPRVDLKAYPSRVERWAGKLQKRFASAAAGGGR